MSLTLVTPPPVEPVTLEEARQHLRLDADGSPASHPDDDLVNGLIQAAREWAESYTRRAFVEQTWKLTLNRFPQAKWEVPRGWQNERQQPIELPLPPLRSVASVTYTDSDGASQTWDSSKWTTHKPDGPRAMPGHIRPVHDETYPTNVLDAPDVVTVEFTAGYAADSSPTDYRANIPESIKAAMKLVIGHWYKNREAADIGVSATEVPMGAKFALAPYVVPEVG